MRDDSGLFPDTHQGETRERYSKADLELRPKHVKFLAVTHPSQRLRSDDFLCDLALGAYVL